MIDRKIVCVNVLSLHYELEDCNTISSKLNSSCRLEYLPNVNRSSSKILKFIVFFFFFLFYFFFYLFKVKQTILCKDERYKK